MPWETWPGMPEDGPVDGGRTGSGRSLSLRLVLQQRVVILGPAGVVEAAWAVLVGASSV